MAGPLTGAMAFSRLGEALQRLARGGPGRRTCIVEMNDLGTLSPQLCQVLQSHPGQAAQECATPATLHCALDGGRRIGLHFLAQQQRWRLGVGCVCDWLDEDARARLEEALLRVGHASRWGLQQAGLGDGQALSLVDCDFPRAPAQLTAAGVEEHVHALLAQLDALAGGVAAEPVAAHAHPRRPGYGAAACDCARAFSAQMQALDAGRRPGSIAPQELLLDEHLAMRIALHPHSHHWVIEAFAWNAALLAGPLRRSLVSALLHINGAALGGRQIICSLDDSDSVVLISRWHADWAAQTPPRAWLDYSLQQARRIRAAAAAIAMQGAPSDADSAGPP